MAVMCLYGQPGSGKTVNSTRLPGKTLLISSDNSALVLKNFERPNLTVKPASNFKEFVDAFEDATKNKQYDNIIVDCLTDLIDAYIVEIREGNVTPLKVGDRIVSIDGIKVVANESISNAISKLSPGTAVKVVVERYQSGEYIQVTESVVLSSRNWADEMPAP